MGIYRLVAISPVMPRASARTAVLWLLVGVPVEVDSPTGLGSRRVGTLLSSTIGGASRLAVPPILGLASAPALARGLGFSLALALALTFAFTAGSVHTVLGGTRAVAEVDLLVDLGLPLVLKTE